MSDSLPAAIAGISNCPFASVVTAAAPERAAKVVSLGKSFCPDGAGRTLACRPLATMRPETRPAGSRRNSLAGIVFPAPECR